MRRNTVDYFAQAMRAIDDPRTKIISFDVFDTLLARPVLEPVDLFHFIAAKTKQAGLIPDFTTSRIGAEKMARKRMKLHEPLREEPTLEMIYLALAEQAGLSIRQRDALKALELEAELQLLCARKAIVELYKYALGTGKKIIAASDSYFSPEFVQQLLERNGFGDIEKLYVSSQLGRTKASGNMFSMIVDDLGVEPHQIIHIGDNIRSDKIRPKALGIRALHIPRGAYLFFTSSISANIWAWDENELTMDYRLILGMIINQRYDTLRPESARSGSLFNGDPELFGYYGLGPVFLARAQDEPPLKTPFAIALLQAVVPTKEGDHKKAPLLQMRQGVRQFAKDAQALFGSDLANLDLSKRQALAPLEQILEAPFAADAGMFDALPFASLRPAVGRVPPRPHLHRRAEIFALKPFLTANLYLRLIHSAPEFFARTNHLALKIYKLWRVYPPKS